MRRPEREQSHEWRIAIHEAGHALLIVLGGRLDWVTIVPGVIDGSRYLGLAVTARCNSAIADIRTDLAGAVATRLAGGSWAEVVAGARIDVELARAAARRVDEAAARARRVDWVPTVDPARSYTVDEIIATASMVRAREQLADRFLPRCRVDLARMVVEVEAEVLRRWDAVEAIARALIEQRTLEGGRVHELVRAHPATEQRRDAIEDWSPLVSALIE